MFSYSSITLLFRTSHARQICYAGRMGVFESLSIELISSHILELR
jgi:hypothetical protein